MFKVPPRVIFDNKASVSHTVIEVNGRDRPGFLHDVTSTLTAQGLQIVSAHISTYGERVVDVFYVKDVFGLKIEHEQKLRAAGTAPPGGHSSGRGAQTARRRNPNPPRPNRRELSFPRSPASR